MTEHLFFMKEKKGDHFEATAVGYGWAVGVWHNRRGGKALEAKQ